MINLTPSAVAEIARLKNYNSQSQPYLRIKVEQGGCADLLYHLNFDGEILKGDRTFDHHQDITILVDEQSYNYIQDLVIDYAEDLMGGSFQYQNPQAQNHCNCGISFSIKAN
ncbi:iron-sulfur cluster assembly accessory protein [Cyanobacterium stanieri LEGE 03274]|uniref:Iron-sulfur cluster assembly accessory protein n=1 Tax=Cyanobacterium stanieri LEGE 03274 TaxID=1828756 RepID=A0ABR9V8H9_9CHRO|nr:iron-sulfur cluster assembly accessory protein [Cyanobacterium stanieri]MBE9223854.1 iron-sulfur cluster assembly accessory protein [Cyanobacterium stanieri LEGE 03274]